MATVKKTNKETRGGARVGAGRKRKYDTGVAVSVTYSVPEAMVPTLNKYVETKKKIHERRD